jgi:hypothetical protein
VLRKKAPGGCWKLKGDRRGDVPFLGFAQIFHKIKSIFDFLNTIRKNMSKSEQTRLLNLSKL